MKQFVDLVFVPVALLCVGSAPCFGQATLNHILSTGQSLSQGALGIPALTKAQPFNNKMLDGSGLGTNLVPLVETNDTETMSSALGNWLTANSPGLSYMNAVNRHGQSGACYSNLMKGSIPYSYGMQQVQNVQNAARGQGLKSAVVAVTVVHGECDQVNQVSAATYEGYLVQWQHDYENDIKVLTGQNGGVPMFTDQVSSMSALGIATPTIPFGQLAAAEDNPGKIYIVGPKYNFTYKDGIHLWSTNYRYMGEMYGKVMKKVLIDGQDWKPLSPRAITRSGNVISAQFWVPVLPLVFDTTRVTAQTNYGFEYWDDSSTPPSITSVAITGPDTVQITLSKTPSGNNQRLRYAYSSIMGSFAGADQTGSARGNLRDSDVTQSPNGYTLPDWCVHFDKPIGTGSVIPVVPPVPGVPPSVSITLPTGAGALSGVVQFTANASSPVGLAGVQFSVDGVKLGAEIPASPAGGTKLQSLTVAWDTTTAANGNHTWSAVARDVSNLSTTATASLAVANGATARWQKGFDFRNTAGFVADGANNTYVLCSDKYPTIRNGMTMGWETPPDGCYDENAGLDPRLAGLAFTIASHGAVFRVDVANGTYGVTVAAGDQKYAQTPYAGVTDGNTALFSIPSSALAAGYYRDSKGNGYTAAQWTTAQQSQSVTVASGILRVTIDAHKSLNTVSLLNHLAISGSAPVLAAAPLASTTSTPFTGTAASIPGQIEAEDFDNGGEGVAYHDTTPSNEGGQYRNNGVDIGTSTSGFAVGWTRPGEWIQYSVNVAAAGMYDLQVKTAIDGTGSSMHFEVNGVNKTGAIAVPDTEGNWTTLTVPKINLAAGPQLLRLVFDSSSNSGYAANVDNFSFTPSASAQSSIGSTPFKAAPFAIPGRFEAEDFDSGGEGVAYHDMTPYNEGGMYRNEDVDIGIGPTGYAVGWTHPGEWMQYSVNVSATKLYQVQLYVSSWGGSSSLHLEVNGVNITGPILAPSTGLGWTTVTIPNVGLAAGLQHIRLVFDSGNIAGYSANVDWISIQ